MTETTQTSPKPSSNVFARFFTGSGSISLLRKQACLQRRLKEGEAILFHSTGVLYTSEDEHDRSIRASEVCTRFPLCKVSRTIISGTAVEKFEFQQSKTIISADL
jgi:hypothetical protein